MRERERFIGLLYLAKKMIRKLKDDVIVIGYICIKRRVINKRELYQN